MSWQGCKSRFLAHQPRGDMWPELDQSDPLSQDFEFIVTWNGNYYLSSSFWQRSCVIPAFRASRIHLPPPNCLDPEFGSPAFPSIPWATSNIFAKRAFPASGACHIQHLTSILLHKIIGCLGSKKSWKSSGQCPHFTAEEIESPRGWRFLSRSHHRACQWQNWE